MSRTEGIPEDKKRPPIVTVARFAKKVTFQRSIDERDFSNVDVNYGESGNYRILQRIGYGRFSCVYDATDIAADKQCVVKTLRSDDEFAVKRELRCLELLRSGPNIINAVNVVQIDVPARRNAIGIVFEKVYNTDHRFLYPMLTDIQIRYYLYQLLRAIAYAHSKGIMHRDIKPDNIVIDHQRKILRLIDWGRATFYMPGQAYSNRVCTLYYRAPEVLLGFRHYDYAVDMWSFGCIAAGMIFRTDVFFTGTNETTQLQSIARVLGRGRLDTFIKRYHVRFVLDGIIADDCAGVSLQSFANPENNDTVTCSGIDLLKKIIVYDHRARLTAYEAKQHSYFQLIKQGHLHYDGQDRCGRGNRGRDGGDENDHTDEAIPWDTTVDDMPEIEPGFARALLESFAQDERKSDDAQNSGEAQQRELLLPNAEPAAPAEEQPLSDSDDDTFDYVDSSDEAEGEQLGNNDREEIYNYQAGSSSDTNEDDSSSSNSSSSDSSSSDSSTSNSSADTSSDTHGDDNPAEKEED